MPPPSKNPLPRWPASASPSNPVPSGSGSNTGAALPFLIHRPRPSGMPWDDTWRRQGSTHASPSPAARKTMKPKGNQPIFLDTSILIARLVHSTEKKQSIERRLAKHSQKVTSLVVRQEFKRRLLREVEYLLRQV